MKNQLLYEKEKDNVSFVKIVKKVKNKHVLIKVLNERLKNKIYLNIRLKISTRYVEDKNNKINQILLIILSKKIMNNLLKHLNY